MASRRMWRDAAALTAVIVAVVLVLVRNAPNTAEHQLINVSYDPTRELFQALNPVFVASYEKATGAHFVIVQSHGGSSSQARKVASGTQQADVVTLGLASDIDALRNRGLVAADWAERLPNHASPYSSTIVFVVRKDNPRRIHDWPDLLQEDLEIVTPDPRSSGNGKLAALAAWAAVVTRGGTQADAIGYLRAIYQHVPAHDEGARAASIRFAVTETGDVHLTWENEALREVAESQGKLQIVYPPVSILAEPSVAWLNTSGAHDDVAAAAKAYLLFLFSDEAQKIIARMGYRPLRRETEREAGMIFPDVKLIPVTAIARDWDDANEMFFGENGIIASILGGQHA